MPMINLPQPSRSELEVIETRMRMEHIAAGTEPQSVKDAKGFEAKQSAWRGEALRFWYLVKQKERLSK